MFRKLLLLLCIAYVVVCYGYPCLVLPFGNYKYTYQSEGVREEVAVQFHMNGTITIKDSEEVNYYKLKGNKVIISVDETFDNNDLTVTLKNMYEFEMPILGVNLRNNVGILVSIGVGALAILLVVTIPKKNKRS